MLGRASCAGLLALGVGVALPSVARAWSEPKAPVYSISVVEGETTVPSHSILSTSGSVYIPHAKEVQVKLRITEPDGLTVAENTSEGGGPEEGVWLGNQVPQVGDPVYLESPVGNIVGSEVYDGLPSIDPTVCAGSTNFSGQRSSPEDVVKGSYETLVVHPTYVANRFGGEAQVPTQSGTSFAGSFLKPLEIGETVKAVESVEKPLEGGALFTYTSENDRPVGACPAPPAPPPPPPPPALQGSIFKLVGTTIKKLLKAGWTDQVTINQPGTVTQDLYQVGGAVPASAAAHRKGHRKHKPPALLLARGSASAAAAGTVSVTLHVTGKGRHALDRSHRMRAVLVTTLKIGSGAKLNLQSRTVTLDR
ncbi:MAG TPA: hypothetical protein VG147_05115 [Solirubrobacteraceae bacterium]|jgi:hypothetical protein|nr:hypothetical protein [Solirubrobacteraceae bacterium]